MLHLFLFLCIFSVSTEYLALMKKVTKSPLVMDVLNITNVQRQLERLADLLSKIQKALGEYLERERASFPRYLLIPSVFFRGTGTVKRKIKGTGCRVLTPACMHASV